MKNFELVPCANAGELARAAASAWLDEIEAANRAVKPYFAALSGGRIAPAFFASTVGQARARAVRFDRVQFFWADERCVPPGDAESNFRLARELLLAPLGIPESQIHRVRGEAPPEIAAAGAEAEIRRIVPLNDARQPALDLVLLGLGEDGHVASLFPGEPEEGMSSQAVYRAITNSPKPPPDRVTLGYAAIAAAQRAWVLVSGAGKEKALRDSLAGSGKMPFARVLKLRNRTTIFTDITRL
jgi:6-phosphogluconolactonase